MSNWDGAERRKGYSGMSEEVQDMKVELASFTSKVNEWMETTKSYRLTLCDKIEKIDSKLSNHVTHVTEKINGLPCRERQSWYISTNKQLGWLWKVAGTLGMLIIGVLTAIIIEWIKKN